MKGKIWLIGGTSESVKIAQLLTANSIPCLVTVNTPDAISVYPHHSSMTVKIGGTALQEISQLCQQETVIGIVDASHPYAVGVSAMTIAFAKDNNIPYIKYAKSPVPVNNPTWIEVDTFETLFKRDYLMWHRVLITVHHKYLPMFQPWQQRCTLFARISPTVSALDTAVQAGFDSNKLIAIHLPITEALEKALWQQWQISLVITKTSGDSGQEEIKRRVSADLGIPLIIISPPKLIPPQQTDDFNQILSFCKKQLLGL